MVCSRRVLGLGTLIAACGPGGPGAGDTTSGVDQPSTATSDAEGASSTTTGSADCPIRIEGDFTVETPEDALGLASVSGLLVVGLDDDDPTPDLSFLGCLESVDHLFVGGTEALTSLDGLTSLTSLNSLTVLYAPRLTTIRGAAWMREMTLLRVGAVDALESVDFPGLERLQKLSVNTAKALETLSFPSLRTVGYIQVGSCFEYSSPNASPLWTSFDGFPAIEEIGIFFVESMYGMAHLDILDSLLANDGTITGAASIRYNPMLPEAEVLEQLAALGVQGDVICANLGGKEECTCGLPD